MKNKREKRKRNNSKLLKQQRVEHKAKYLNRIKSICNKINSGHIYNLIPREELEKIYKHRLHAFKFVPAEGNEIAANVMSDIRSLCNDHLREAEIIVTNDGIKFSLFEFLTIGMNFLEYIDSLKEDKFPKASVVKEIKNKFKDFNQLFDESHLALQMYNDSACFLSSELNSKLYWIMHEFYVDKKKPNGIENLMKVYSSVPEKIYDNKDNNYRPAIRLCIGLSQIGLGYFQFNPELMKISLSDKDSYLGIYIQTHALQRLNERLDCLNTMWQNIHLIRSLTDAEVHRDEKDTYFIAFKITEIKIGYLVADLNQNRLIIRTFLFITQHGTPEGNKLAEMYGLGKLDKTYLELDKLSTFVSKDMCSNAKLSDVFQQVGCQYLLDISVDNRIKKMCDIKSKSSSVFEIINYLQLNERKDDLKKKQTA
ncbi:MAG: hypothetical protein M1480_03170 [Bacteroidetes bacterium]|nr:hypothetical protein [Bacteroidota bacterium]